MDNSLTKMSKEDCVFVEKSFSGMQSRDAKEYVNKRRRTIHDEKLLKVFLSKPDQPLASEIKCCNEKEDFVTSFSDENTPPINGFPYISSSNCQHLEGNHLEKDTLVLNEMSSPQTPNNQEDATRKENPFFARIQRDLNSPSAAARMRALKALKNPTKNSYSNFDVPHEEQDIITEEERTSPTRPRSIQEVMKNVVVYVEVRTGEDNRSAGVKKVISLLGAKVNDKFLRDTTHVVFKDGVQSTYNKAKKWNIPIVSILWIEACKKQMKLINPNLFPISNVERYENPDLFIKSRRLKSMQPHAEEYSRRKKLKTSKETEVGKTVKINSVLRIPRKPKDKLGEIFSEFQEKLMSTPDNNEDAVPFESKLLQRLRNSPFTPKSLRKEDISTKNSLQRSTPLDSTSAQLDDNDDDFEECLNNKTLIANAKKTLIFSDSKNHYENTTKQTVSAKTPRRRNGTMDMKNICYGQLNRSRRSLFNVGTLSKMENDIPKAQTLKKLKTGNIVTTEKNSIRETLESNSEKKGHRGTSFTARSMEISIEINRKLCLSPINSTEKYNLRRRTLYTPQPIEQCNSIDKTAIDTKKISTNKSRPLGLMKPNGRRNTIYNPSCPQQELLYATQINNRKLDTQHDISKEEVTTDKCCSKTSRTLLEEHAATLSFSSTKTPQNSKQQSLFDISMGIINQRLQSINKSAKQNKIECANILQEYSTTPICKKTEDDSHWRINLERSMKDANNTTSSCDFRTDKSKISVGTSASEQVSKKRKLFAPVDMLLTPPLLTQKGLNSSQSSSKKRIRENDNEISVDKRKRRKTLFHPFTCTHASTKEKLYRRSTMDFEAMQTKTSSAINNVESKLPFLVYTNMHTEQINFINKVVNQLGGFQIEDTVSENTTHIVTLEPRRTINLLRGIIRGLWILNYNWVTDSAASGKWLLEEQYEVRNFSRAIEICRSERQAFGADYRVDIFGNCGPIYVSKNSNIPAEYLAELITLSAGRIVESKRKAKYIIGEICDKYQDKVCLQPNWILDSITNIQLKKIPKYVIKPDLI